MAKPAVFQPSFIPLSHAEMPALRRTDDGTCSHSCPACPQFLSDTRGQLHASMPGHRKRERRAPEYADSECATSPFPGERTYI